MHPRDVFLLYVRITLGLLFASMFAGGLLDDAKTYAIHQGSEWDTDRDLPLVFAQVIACIIAATLSLHARYALSHTAFSMYARIMIGVSVASVCAGGLLDDLKTYAIQRGRDWDNSRDLPIVLVQTVVCAIAVVVSLHARYSLSHHR